MSDHPTFPGGRPPGSSVPGFRPHRFGRYLLLEQVSLGGMAEIFRAKSFGVDGFERYVAIKRILPQLSASLGFVSMFIDEAKIAVQLTHPNIAQILDLGKIGDHYFICLEFVDGKDLRAIWERRRKANRPVHLPLACHLVMAVCDALDYTHQKRDAKGAELCIVHRDVSPHNIMVSYAGEVKIIDFGIAKAQNRSFVTPEGVLKGKFGYMSPEQAGGEPLDRRSDLFSAGVILYEFLTGQRLFDAESDIDVLEMVRRAEIPPPRRFYDAIPRALEEIVLQALARDPDRRFATAGQFRDALRPFLAYKGGEFDARALAAYMKRAFKTDLTQKRTLPTDETVPCADRPEIAGLYVPDADGDEDSLVVANPALEQSISEIKTVVMSRKRWITVDRPPEPEPDGPTLSAPPESPSPESLDALYPDREATAEAPPIDRSEEPTAPLGDLKQVPRVVLTREELLELNLDHRAGFLLSLVDGRLSLEEILDLAGMPAAEGRAILARLMAQQVITTKPDEPI